MSKILAIGVNHKKTAIELREKFFLSSLEKEFLLRMLKNLPQVLGAFVLSTCNRTEIYVDSLEESSAYIIELLLRVKNLQMEQQLLAHFYDFKDDQATEHLFKVVTGLDSLVLGEKQILGQVKNAVEVARNAGMMSRDLNILTHLAIRAGKKAQSETEVGYGGSSVSWAAVVTVQKRLISLSGKKVLVIGTGKMGHMAVNQLMNKGTESVFIMNRTCHKAESLAEQTDGIAVGFWELKEILSQIDACVCSAGAPHYLIDRELVEEVMRVRNNRTLLLIDVSMPRNIDPAAESVPGVELLTIDKLDEVVEESVRRRKNSIQDVEWIIEQKQREYIIKRDKAYQKQNALLHRV